MTEVEPSSAMRDIIAEVMDIEDFILDSPQATLRARGNLTVPSQEAFDLLESRLAELDHTPIMYREADGDHVLVVESEIMAPTRALPWLSGILLLFTLVRVIQLGVQQEATVALAGPLDYFRNITAALTFSGVVLGVLLARELARFVVARRHRLKISLPYFIPLPGLTSLFLAPFTLLGERAVFFALGIATRTVMPWGTLGGIVAQRTPARDRRGIFDMAVAATLAGFLVSLIALVAGLLQSEVMTIDFSQAFLLEGQSLGYRLIKLAMFGQWLPGGGEDVFISTLALAGWTGLLLTMLHLMPYGSLDGGHIVYGLAGQRGVAWGRRTVVVTLVLLSLVDVSAYGLGLLPVRITGYLGWLLWLAIIVLFRRDNAQVLDEITPLGTVRRIVGILMLVLLVLLFTPVPFLAWQALRSGPVV